MRIFIDACVDPRVAELFPDHNVSTAFDLGWQALPDSEIVRRCNGSFEVLITADRSFEHQHNRFNMTFGIVIVHVRKNKVEFYRELGASLLNAVVEVGEGEVLHVY